MTPKGLKFHKDFFSLQIQRLMSPKVLDSNGGLTLKISKDKIHSPTRSKIKTFKFYPVPLEAHRIIPGPDVISKNIEIFKNYSIILVARADRSAFLRVKGFEIFWQLAAFVGTLPPRYV